MKGQVDKSDVYGPGIKFLEPIIQSGVFVKKLL